MRIVTLSQHSVLIVEILLGDISQYVERVILHAVYDLILKYLPHFLIITVLIANEPWLFHLQIIHKGCVLFVFISSDDIFQLILNLNQEVKLLWVMSYLSIGTYLRLMLLERLTTIVLIIYYV